MIFVLTQFPLTWCLQGLVAPLTSTSVIPTVRPRGAPRGTVVGSWSSRALVPVVERYIAKMSYSLYSVIFLVCLSLFVCLGFIVPLENISLMEMSPIRVKGCKFWPMLGTRCHWAVRVLKRATSTVTQVIRL